MAGLGADLLVKTLQSLRAGTLEARPQDPEQASYAPPLKKIPRPDRLAAFAPELDFWIRGLTPWPGAFTFLRGKRLIIHCAQPLEGKASGEPGTIVSFEHAQIQVLTGEGTLSLLEIQLEGHRRLNSQDFLIGFHLRVGEKLGP